MTTELVPVFAGEIAGAPTQLVDARLLHGFLEVLTRFNDWIRTRIEEYGFVEHQDFLVTENRVTKTTRGGDRRSKGYHISLDMAKELAMVERTDKGREVRRYFIECERRAMTGLPNAIKSLEAPTITPSEQQTVHEIIEYRAKDFGPAIGKAKAEMWKRLHNKFRIAQYAQLPREQLADALVYLMNMDLRTKHPALPAPEPVELPRYNFPLANWQPATRIGATAWFTFQEWVRLREQGSSQLAELIYTLGRDGHDVSGPQTEFRGLCHMVESMHMQWESMRYMFDKMEGRGLRIQLQPASA